METLEQISKRYKRKTKCYSIDFARILDGFTACDVDCLAGNLNKARSILFDKVKHEDWELNYGEKITYLNIPVNRKEIGDLHEFEGMDVALWKINEILCERERISELDAIASNNDIAYCYIKKHGEYYRPDCCGYSSFQIYAGVYDKYEAIRHAKSCNELHIIPINTAEHNDKIITAIKELTTRLITSK